MTAREGQKTALITGASTGIGYELAKLFASDGFQVVLVARNAQKLAEVAKELEEQFHVSATIAPRDLALPSSPDELFRTLQHDGLQVDVLVNNAGFGTHGSFSESDLTQQLQMMQVNMVALSHLTKLFLPGMISRGWGKILNVASTAAFQPGPLMAVYYASKAFVVSFSEALANELGGTGVTVTVLCPGPTRTEFQKRAGVGEANLVTSRIMDARTVARAGYRGLMAGKTVVIPGTGNQFLALLVKFMPRTVVTQVVRGIQEKRRLRT